MSRPHSYSSVSTFLGCPLRYKLTYRDRRSVERGSEPVGRRLGSAVHAALEAAAKAHLLGEQMRFAADEALADAWCRYELSSTDASIDQTADHVLAAIEVLRSRFDDGCEVVDVERKISATLADGSSFVGYSDLVLRRGGAVVVWDWKHSSPYKTADELRKDPQLLIYAYHLLREFDWAETALGAHGYTAVSPPVVRVTELPRDLVDLAARRFLAAVELIDTETSWSPRPGSACRWCDHSDICPAVQPTAGERDEEVFREMRNI